MSLLKHLQMQMANSIQSFCTSGRSRSAISKFQAWHWMHVIRVRKLETTKALSLDRCFISLVVSGHDRGCASSHPRIGRNFDLPHVIATAPSIAGDRESYRLQWDPLILIRVFLKRVPTSSIHCELVWMWTYVLQWLIVKQVCRVFYNVVARTVKNFEWTHFKIRAPWLPSFED